MLDAMPALLLTRPQAASERFAAALPAGVACVISPLLRIVSFGGAVPLDGVRGVILTSRNGVEAAGPGQPMPAWCVGERTTEAARAAGWQAECAGLDAATLVDRLIAAPPEAPLLHLRGVHTRGGIAARLTAAGITTSEHVVYDQEFCPLSDAARALVAGNQPVIAPLFSPRTATHFAATCAPRAGLVVAAISDATAKALKDKGYDGVHVADTPDEAAMIRLVLSLLQDVRSA